MFIRESFKQQFNNAYMRFALSYKEYYSPSKIPILGTKQGSCWLWGMELRVY